MSKKLINNLLKEIENLNREIRRYQSIINNQRSPFEDLLNMKSKRKLEFEDEDDNDVIYLKTIKRDQYENKENIPPLKDDVQYDDDATDFEEDSFSNEQIESGSILSQKLDTSYVNADDFYWYACDKPQALS